MLALQLVVVARTWSKYRLMKVYCLVSVSSVSYWFRFKYWLELCLGCSCVNGHLPTNQNINVCGSIFGFYFYLVLMEGHSGKSKRQTQDLGIIININHTLYPRKYLFYMVLTSALLLTNLCQYLYSLSGCRPETRWLVPDSTVMVWSSRVMM